MCSVAGLLFHEKAIILIKRKLSRQIEWKKGYHHLAIYLLYILYLYISIILTTE